MPYTFYPPQTMESWPTRDKWWRRWVSPRGTAVLITGTTVTITKVPTQDELAAAQFAYEGGRLYTISDAQGTFLQSLGFPVKTVEQAEALRYEDHDGFMVSI